MTPFAHCSTHDELYQRGETREGGALEGDAEGKNEVILPMPW